MVFGLFGKSAPGLGLSKEQEAIHKDVEKINVAKNVGDWKTLNKLRGNASTKQGRELADKFFKEAHNDPKESDFGVVEQNPESAIPAAGNFQSPNYQDGIMSGGLGVKYDSPLTTTNEAVPGQPTEVAQKPEGFQGLFQGSVENNRQTAPKEENLGFNNVPTGRGAGHPQGGVVQGDKPNTVKPTVVGDVSIDPGFKKEPVKKTPEEAIDTVDGSDHPLNDELTGYANNKLKASEDDGSIEADFSEDEDPFNTDYPEYDASLMDKLKSKIGDFKDDLPAAGKYLKNLANDFYGNDKKMSLALLKMSANIFGGKGVANSFSEFTGDAGKIIEHRETELKKVLATPTGYRQYAMTKGFKKLQVKDIDDLDGDGNTGETLTYDQLNSTPQGKKFLDGLATYMSGASESEKLQIAKEYGLEGIDDRLLKGSGGNSKVAQKIAETIGVANAKDQKWWTDNKGRFAEGQLKTIENLKLAPSAIQAEEKKDNAVNRNYKEGYDDKKFRPNKVPNEGLGRLTYGTNSLFATEGSAVNFIKQAFETDKDGSVSINKSAQFRKWIPGNPAKAIDVGKFLTNMVQAGSFTGLAGLEPLIELLEDKGGTVSVFANDETALAYFGGTFDQAAAIANDYLPEGNQLNPHVAFVTQYNKKHGSGGGRKLIEGIVSGKIPG